MDKLPEAEQEEFKAKSQGAMKLLLGKIKELQLCPGGRACARAKRSPLVCLRHCSVGV